MFLKAWRGRNKTIFVPTFVTGYTSFVMTPNSHPIDVKKYPVGYITDYQPRKLTANLSEDTGYEDISIALTNMPEAANVKIQVDVLNFTASNNPRFTIESWPRGMRLEVLESMSQNNTSYQIYPKAASGLKLKYYGKNKEITGELVRLTYQGLFVMLNTTHNTRYRTWFCRTIILNLLLIGLAWLSHAALLQGKKFLLLFSKLPYINCKVLTHFIFQTLDGTTMHLEASPNEIPLRDVYCCPQLIVSCPPPN